MTAAQWEEYVKWWGRTQGTSNPQVIWIAADQIERDPATGMPLFRGKAMTRIREETGQILFIQQTEGERAVGVFFYTLQEAKEAAGIGHVLGKSPPLPPWYHSNHSK